MANGIVLPLLRVVSKHLLAHLSTHNMLNRATAAAQGLVHDRAMLSTKVERTPSTTALSRRHAYFARVPTYRAQVRWSGELGALGVQTRKLTVGDA